MHLLILFKPFFDNIYVYWSLVALVLFALWFIVGTWNFGLYKQKGIPTPFVLPFIGNFIQILFYNAIYYDSYLINKFGSFVGVYFCALSTLLVSDVDVIKQILVKDSAFFTDRNTTFVVGFPFRKALSVLEGDDWKRVRTLLTPTFTTGKLKKMSPLIVSSIRTFSSRFIKAAETKEDIDIKDYSGGLSMEIIAKTMFGMDMDLQISGTVPFNQHAKTMFSACFSSPFLLVLLICPSFKGILQYFFKNGFMPTETLNFFVNTVEDAIKLRNGEEKNYQDFLALMLRTHSEKLDELRKDSDIEGLSHEEILAQSLIFMLAGYETTASTIQFFLYFMAMNQDIQDKCRAEINREIGDNEMDYEGVGRLEYLDQCIQETLRLCPAASRLERICTKDTTLELADRPSIPIKKGESVSVPLYYMHTRPDVWDEPMRFNPDRFTLEEKELRNPYYYMPFGMGPRNCIGMRFAQLELKFALASALKAARFVPSASTPKTLKYKSFVLLTPVIPIFLKTEKLY